MHASSALMADVRRDAGNAQASAEPLLTALEHIEKRGSLLSLVPDRGQRLEWMGALTKQRFVRWNAQDAKYELTSLAANTLRRLGPNREGRSARSGLLQHARDDSPLSNTRLKRSGMSIDFLPRGTRRLRRGCEPGSRSLRDFRRKRCARLCRFLFERGAHGRVVGFYC